VQDVDAQVVEVCGLVVIVNGDDAPAVDAENYVAQVV
jgi:hypothetical protein